MIRVRNRVIEYPNRTVLADVITRSGPPTKESFTPFRGCADIVKSQFSGDRQEGKYNESEFLRYCAPMDFNPTRSRYIVPNGILVDPTKGTFPFVKLEDLVKANAEDNIRKWVVDMCIGYKKRGPYSQFRNYTMTYSSEDGDFTPEQELLVSYSDTRLKQRDREIYLKKLPYYVRLIWNYSVMYKANLFGFIYAWMDITINQHKTRIVPQWFNGNYIYERLKSDGSHHRNFEYSKDIRDTTFRNVLEIFCRPDLYTTEYAIFKEFANIILALDIDFLKENCMDITKDVVANLKCTYLPTFKEYTTQYSDLDIEINYAIKSANLFNTKKIDIYKNANLSVEENNINMFLHFASERIKFLYTSAKGFINRGKRNPVVDLFNHSEEDASRLFTEYVYKVTGQRIDFTSELNFDRDVFIYKGNEPLIVKGAPFGLYSSTSEYDVVFTVYGFVVIVQGTGQVLTTLSYEEGMKKLGEEYVTNQGTKWIDF